MMRGILPGDSPATAAALSLPMMSFGGVTVRHPEVPHEHQGIALGPRRRPDRVLLPREAEELRCRSIL
jgi:hypothetical protein